MAEKTQLHSTEEIQEKVVLVGIDLNNDNTDVDACLDELSRLIETAGAVEVGRLIQKRERINPGLYLGTGKVEELKNAVAELGATGVVCDDELSPAQLKNLESCLLYTSRCV